MQLLLDNPLWIAIIIVTIALHVGFFVGIRRLLRQSEKQSVQEKQGER